MMRRRQWLTGAGLLLAGCAEDRAQTARVVDPLDALPATGNVPEVVRITVTPSGGTKTTAFFAPLLRYLKDKHKINAKIVLANHYDEVAPNLVNGKADLGIFSPLAFVKARDEVPAVPFATATRGGSPTYVGYLLVHPESGLERLEQLQGKRIAWVNKSSTSGYLYPRAMLRARGHANPDRFFASPPVFAGDHESALDLVAQRKVDVAAVAEPFVDLGAGSERKGLSFSRKGQTDAVVVAKTARIPLDCVVMHKTVQQAFGKRLRDALLELFYDDETNTALVKSWGINGFVPYKAKPYDRIAVVRREAQAAGDKL